MPRVLVTTDNPALVDAIKRSGQVLFDEEVLPTHLDSVHSNVQLLERLMWGIEDAAKRERALRRKKAAKARDGNGSISAHDDYLDVAAC